jgi:hypothetical protein
VINSYFAGYIKTLQPDFMTRRTLTAFLLGMVSVSFAQPKQISFGVFTGITAPYTWDDGISNDSRYKPRYEVKFAPIGVAYGVDYQGFGFVVTPSLITIGQNFHMINSVAGQEGTRKINMKYLELPVALKLHMIDLSFFKVSLVASVGVGYLLDGKETISHRNAKYRFPSEVYAILPESYTLEYDGVLAPEVNKLPILEKKDFNSIQVFGAFGFRSDWDVSENWRVSFDVRANYGLLETRTDAYIKRMESYETLYDMAGKRREIFACLSIGIARYMEVNREKEHKTKSFRKFTPKRAMPVYVPKRRKG